MQQNNESNSPSSTPESTSSAGIDQQGHAGKFAFPGSLGLHPKLLTKKDKREEYEALYRLRYQVYCHEAHFLDPDNYADGLECDAYDDVARHILVATSNGYTDIVGAVRLVRWSEQLAFPTTAYFQPLLQQLGRLNFPLHSTAEISRLCIAKQFRRRATDGLFGVESTAISSDQRRRYPVVILELFKTMYLASKYKLGITHWIATFEDRLYQMLDRYGVHLDLLVPDEIDYYGKVRIYGASLEHVEQEMKKRRPELYAFFREQLEP